MQATRRRCTAGSPPSLTAADRRGGFRAPVRRQAAAAGFAERSRCVASAEAIVFARSAIGAAEDARGREVGEKRERGERSGETVASRCAAGGAER